MPTDEEGLIRRHRARFRDGPVGRWYTSLGGGFEITHGCNIRFAPNGSGSYRYWGGPDEDPAGEVEFEWRPVGSRRIVVSSREEAEGRLIEYDFFARRNEYGIVEVCIFQTDHPEIEVSGEPGFWVSGYPLVHSATEERWWGRWSWLWWRLQSNDD